jgi:hypothetical protein
LLVKGTRKSWRKRSTSCRDASTNGMPEANTLAGRDQAEDDGPDAPSG